MQRTLQEFVLQSPDMMHSQFYIKKESKQYQDWDRSFYDNDGLEFFYEEEQIWLQAVVKSTYIDDGSGNAPGANAHYWLLIERDGEKYRYTLHSDLRIRVEAPTDDALMQVEWCEGGDWYYQGPYNPETYTPCSEKGKKYITKHGQACWYCDEHIPLWLKDVLQVQGNGEVQS